MTNELPAQGEVQKDVVALQRLIRVEGASEAGALLCGAALMFAYVLQAEGLVCRQVAAGVIEAAAMLAEGVPGDGSNARKLALGLADIVRGAQAEEGSHGPD